MQVFNFRAAVGGDTVDSGSMANDLAGPSNLKLSFSWLLEVKAIARACYLTFFLESSTFPKIRYKGKESEIQSNSGGSSLNKLTFE